MKLWLPYPVLVALLLSISFALESCRKRPAPTQAWQVSPESVPSNAPAARPVPHRAQPLFVTNRSPLLPVVTEPVTNAAPTIACGGAQLLPCASADGTQVTLTVHVSDFDSTNLTLMWVADDKDAQMQKVAANAAPVAMDVSTAFTLGPGDHLVRVSVTDGTMAASCESSVSVQADRQAPVIVGPRDIALPIDPGHCSAVVTFAPRVTDNCPDVTVVCEPASGSAFPIGTTTVSCQATDAAGNSSECAFAVAVQISNRCPHMDSYWRQSMGAWPINAMTLGTETYTRSQVVPLLHAPAPGDASITLARQLITATLNTAAGSDPRIVCAELDQANQLLAGFPGKLPYRVPPASAVGHSMLAVAERLRTYNGGAMVDGCVP